MATKEITKRETRYVDPELEQELVAEVEEGSASRVRTVAHLAVLWQNRRFLARCAAVGFVFWSIVVFLIPVRYTSTTRLMPPDQTGAGVASMLAALGKAGSGGDLGVIGSELLGIRTSSDLFVGVLRSRTIEEDLVNKFDLRKVYGTHRMESACQQLEERTDVMADRKSGIITIKVSDHNPQRAAEMAKEYIAGLDRIVVTLNTSSAHKERVFLEQRLAEVQQDLEASEKDFSEFASKHTTIDIKEQGKAMIGAAAELEGQLIAAQTELQGLRQIYTENNVRVRAVQARIDELQRQLQKLGGKVESPQDAGSMQTEDMYPSIRRLPVLGVEYADLFRRGKIEEAVFETLTKQYEMAKVEEARETPSVKVLDEGDLPDRKSFPPRTLFVVLGVFLFVGVGSLWILAKVRWERIDPQDPAKLLAKDVFQTIKARARGWRRAS
jgi:capsule polysaccharide export protein KpsE/RkpR